MPSTADIKLDVDGAHPFSGTKALHVKANVTSGGLKSVQIGTMAGEPAFAKLPDNTGYVRLMMYFTALNGAFHGRVLRVGDATVGQGGPGKGYALAFESGMTVETFTDKFGERIKPALNEWICFEVKFGSNLQWWMNDKELMAPAGGAAPLEMLTLGFNTYKPVTTEYWVDDVVMDSKRIGCPKK